MPKQAAIILKALKYLAAIILAAIAGTIILTAVYCFPTESMQQNAVESSRTLSSEGFFPVFWGDDLGGSTLDNFTDALMIQNAAYPVSGNALYDALSVKHMQYTDKMMPVDDLESQVKDKTGGQGVEYARYWHGYLMFLKPLLMIFNYSQIRVINAIMQAVLFCALLYMMKKSDLTGYILPLIVSWLGIAPWVLSYSMQLSCIYYLSLAGSILLLKYYKQLKPRIYIFFFIIGILTSYFDLLTWPAASLGIPLIFLLLLEVNNNEYVKHKLLKVIYICINWGIGYLGMWASKWIIGEAVLGSGTISKSIGALEYRVSETADNGEAVSLLMVWRQNLGRLCNPAFLITASILVIVLVILCIRGLLQIRAISDIVQVVLPFILVALIPFVWYAVIRNHSYSHPSLVYRGLWISMFAGFSALTAFIKCKWNRQEIERT